MRARDTIAPSSTQRPTPGARGEPSEVSGDTRLCSKCREELPLSAFNRYGDGYQWWCRECFRRYFRERGDVHRTQSGAALKRRREQARHHVAAYLQTHPCADCQEAEVVVLEFDHVGVKRLDVARLVSVGSGIAELDAEIASCEVVCATVIVDGQRADRTGIATRPQAGRRTTCGRPYSSAISFGSMRTSFASDARTAVNGISPCSTLITSYRSVQTSPAWDGRATPFARFGPKLRSAKSVARTATAGEPLVSRATTARGSRVTLPP